MIKSELSSRSRSKTRKLEDAPRTRRAGDDDASLYTVRLRIPYTHHADQTFLTMISRTNLLLSGTYVLGCCSNELLRTNSHQPHLSLTNPTSLSLSLSAGALAVANGQETGNLVYLNQGGPPDTIGAWIGTYSSLIHYTSHPLIANQTHGRPLQSRVGVVRVASELKTNLALCYGRLGRREGEIRQLGVH